MRLRSVVIVVLLAALPLAACGIATPSDNTIEDVSGTIPVKGGDYHSYTFKRTGEVEVRITSITPSPSASLGIGIGQVTSGTCTLLQGYLSSLVANRAVNFPSLTKGDYCLLVYDTGVLTTTTTYSGTISHP